ncbi:MAG: hypothetical protein U1F15_09035 [Burkholderiales bacterium]
MAAFVAAFSVVVATLSAARSIFCCAVSTERSPQPAAIGEAPATSASSRILVRAFIVTLLASCATPSSQRHRAATRCRPERRRV